jgi:hypothetical protein
MMPVVFPAEAHPAFGEVNQAMIGDGDAMGTPCSNGSKSESSGSANVQTANSGAEPGSIRNLDRHDAHRLAQAILKRRSSS